MSLNSYTAENQKGVASHKYADKIFKFPRLVSDLYN